MIVMWVCTRGESPCDNWKAFQTNYTISASLVVLQGRKYVKRSELERVQVSSSPKDQHILSVFPNKQQLTLS